MPGDPPAIEPEGPAMTDRLDVMIEKESTDADLAVVTRVFDAAGIPVKVHASVIRLSAGDLPWIVGIGIPVAAAWTFLKATLEGAGDEAGRDGWRALMGLVKGIYDNRNAVSGAPGGEVTITTPNPQVEIVLSPDLPELAYRRLWEIEEPRAPMSGILRWDPERRTWIDPLAGLLRCRYVRCPEPAIEGRVRQLSPTAIERREFCSVHAAAADLGDDQAWV
jgi:hypothetical protein